MSQNSIPPKSNKHVPISSFGHARFIAMLFFTTKYAVGTISPSLENYQINWMEISLYYWYMGKSRIAGYSLQKHHNIKQISYKRSDFGS